MTSEYQTDLPQTMRGTAAPVKMWIPEHEVEAQALGQIRAVADLPWVKQVAIMPDVHMGVGASIGTVIAMEGAVSPSTVGVDIGCGMAAVPTSLTAADLPEDLGRLRADIEKTIPVGFNGHQGSARVPDRAVASRVDRHLGTFGSLKAEKISDRESKAVAQCGTLGGGNHFIELTTDEKGRVWLMLHSGSRNIGKELAERHISTAKTLDHNATLPDKNLAVFLADSDEMSAYMHDLTWAQQYALLNREVMLALYEDVVRKHFPAVTFGDRISAHHNYVEVMDVDGTEMIVTRKGAISARAGELGLIPGSMGTGSYVVRGLGNTDGLQSASHGAGRKMSRSKAKKTFTVDDLAEQTKGVECRKDAGVIDEAPGAYKDLGQVIAYQSEGESPLVEVVEKLTTLLCVKG